MWKYIYMNQSKETTYSIQLVRNYALHYELGTVSKECSGHRKVCFQKVHMSSFHLFFRDFIPCYMTVISGGRKISILAS